MTEQPAPDFEVQLTQLNTDIYGQLNKIMAELPNIPKRQGQHTGEYFADEDVVNYLRPLLVKHGVIVHPSEIHEAREQTFTVENNGQTTRKFKTSIVGKVRFAAASDGSYIDVPSMGSSIDARDKDATQALTFFVRNAILKTFLFATEDRTTHDDQPLSVPAEETAVPGMGVSVKRSWKPDEIEKATRWFVECGGLPDGTETSHVIALLNLSPLTQGFLKGDLVAWASEYRDGRNAGLKAGEAALQATLNVRAALDMGQASNDSDVPF